MLKTCFSVNSGFARANSGSTFVELLVVVAIVGFFATVLAPAFDSMRVRAEKVVCIGNIRSLHVAASAYLADHKRWPQPSEDFTEEQFDDFWVEVLEPYGGTEKGWSCPSIRRMARFESMSEEDRKKFDRLHYLPSSFDDKPTRPHQHPTHPWFMEVGGPHGNGNIIVQADGRVRELNEVLREAGYAPGDSSL